MAANPHKYRLSADDESLAQFRIRSYLANVIFRIGVKNTIEKVIQDLVDMLASYRSENSQNVIQNQLAVPDRLRLLPLYLHSALKLPAFKMLHMTQVDLKIAQIVSTLSLSVDQMSYLLYPRIYRVTNISQSPKHGY